MPEIVNMDIESKRLRNDLEKLKLSCENHFGELRDPEKRSKLLAPSKLLETQTRLKVMQVAVEFVIAESLVTLNEYFTGVRR